MEDQGSTATPTSVGTSQNPVSTDPTPIGPSQNLIPTDPTPTPIGSTPLSLPPPATTHALQEVEVDKGKRKRKEPEKVPDKKPSSKSEVWDYFVKLPFEQTNGEHKAVCKYCNTCYLCDPVKHGTNSLKRHIPKCAKNPHKATTDNKQSMLNYMSTGTGVQQGRGLVAHVYDEKRCRRALSKFVICDEQAFRIVEKEGFKQFVHELEPRFPIPSRMTVARDCWQLYNGEKKMLKKALKKYANRVCLTTDCWTSTQNFNYLCLTAHFIDPEWKLHKRILNFCMIENHKGDTIGKTIEKCLLDWGVDKVFTITMDNATSNDTALAYLKRRLKSWKGLVCGGDYLQIRCCAHVLNLVVNEGIKELRDSFDAIRNSVRYVRSSPSRLQKFKVWADAEKIDTKSLVCLDVSTRWNSTYLMLEAALKFQKVFERMLDEDDDYRSHFNLDSRRDGTPRHQVPTTNDWSKARVFLKFLKVFYDITLMFSSTLNVTSNLCFHQITRIQQMLQKNITDSDPLLGEMSFSMHMKYEKYWGRTDNMNPLLIVGVVLDPRYKMDYVNHRFQKMFSDADVVEAMTKKVKDCLYCLFDEYSMGVSTQSNIDPTFNSGGASIAGLSGALSSSFTNDDDEDPGAEWLQSMKQRTTVDPQSELDKYLSSNLTDDISSGVDFDILAWWKANSTKFKVLSCMARDVFAIPVSTVASESAFSTGGRVVDQYRSSLSPKMTEALISAQNWLQPGQSLSELVGNLREFDNFEETENIVQSDVAIMHDDEGGLFDSITTLDN